MQLSDDFKKRMYQEMVQVGCCNRCALRYLNCKIASFENAEEYSKLMGFISEEDVQMFEPEAKKSKRTNPCIVCLDILGEDFIREATMQNNILNALHFDSTTFCVQLNAPTCVLIRDYSMKLYLRQKFGCNFIESDGHIVSISATWRRSVQNSLCKTLNKNYDPRSKFILFYTVEYSLEDEETGILLDMLGKNRATPISKRHMVDKIKKIDIDWFKKFASIPPKSPFGVLKLSGLTTYSNPIYIVGRYTKYSRGLNQVPHHNKHNMEVVVDYSIQSIIFRAIKKVTRQSDMKFEGSSREIRTVRVLGKGRLFSVTITNPTITTITRTQFREIEGEVAKSCLIKVNSMEMAEHHRAATSMLEQERHSSVQYKVLCHTFNRDASNCVSAINNIKSPITVAQKPVIFNLPTLHNVKYLSHSKTKFRQVFNLKACKVDDPLRNNLFELDIKAQSAFSIFEFIHGDLGRTRPSLCDLLGYEVDCLAVDIIDFSRSCN